MNAFSRIFVVSTVALLLVIATVNRILDPYALFETRRIDGFNRYKPVGLNYLRLSKASRVNAGAYQAVILGSSRTGRGLNCAMLDYGPGACYNGSSTAASLLESYRYLQQVYPQKLQTVYLGLDLFTSVDPAMLNSSFVDERLRLDISGKGNYRYPQQALQDFFSALVSGQTLRHSRNTYFSQDKTVVLPSNDGMPELYSDGSWGNDPSLLIEKGGSLRGKKQLQRFTHMYLLMQQHFEQSQKHHERLGKSIHSTIGQHLDSFREIVRFGHRHGLDLKLFINSAHAYHWRLLYDYDNGRLLAYWKRQLLAITESVAQSHGAEPFPVFDFSGFHSVSVEEVPSRLNDYRFMSRYQDIMHYSLETGRRMISVIDAGCHDNEADGWGYCLDRSRLASRLRKQRLQNREFRRLNEREWASFEASLNRARIQNRRARTVPDALPQDAA